MAPNGCREFASATATLPGTIANLQSRAGLSLSEGAFVVDVEAGGIAAKAGLQKFDVIQQLGTYYIRSEGDLNNALVWLRSGEAAELKFLRYPVGKFNPEGMSAAAGEVQTVKLVLE
jgi:S1-C subfamily serine protease